MDILTQVLLGLAAYLGTALTKIEGWNKYAQWLFFIVVAGGIGFFTASGQDPNEVFQRIYTVVGSASAFWGVGKLTGANNALRANILSNIINAMTKPSTLTPPSTPAGGWD